MTKKFIRVVVICFLSAALFGCGYSFVQRGESLDSLIQKVYIAPFVNKTSQAELEYYFRSAFMNTFIQNSRFKMARDVHEADAVVRGTILNYNTTPLARLRDDLAAEERATVVMEVVFEDNINGKILWRTTHMTDSEDYRLSRDINMVSSARRNALMKLANDMAEKAFNLMMSGF